LESTPQIARGVSDPLAIQTDPDKTAGSSSILEAEIATRRTVDKYNVASGAHGLMDAEFDILYGVGINVPGEIVDLATAAGLFEKSGSFYSFKGARIAQGRDKACAYVAEHPEIAQQVRLTLLEARKAENAALGTPAPTLAQAA
jgi:hypothetical protein